MVSAFSIGTSKRGKILYRNILYKLYIILVKIPFFHNLNLLLKILLKIIYINIKTIKF